MSLYVDIKKRLGSFTLKTKFETDSLITGLLGASGSGKSMSLKCIAGIQKPDEGVIMLDGEVLFDSSKGINIRPQDRHVGYLFQEYALFPNMSVKKNILAGMSHVKDRLERERRLEAVISLMKLEGLEEHRPSQLSGGQAQRVALARIIVSEPKLLLLDEPFSALDNHLKDSIQVDMKHLIEKLGTQSILVTHSVTEAFRLSNSISVMEDGCVIRSGKCEELLSDPQKEGCARLFGHRNIFQFIKRDGNLYIPELQLSLRAEDDIPEGADKISITDDAIKAGGLIKVNGVEVLKEERGSSLLVDIGGERKLWWKTELHDVDHIAIDTARCLFLR
ncbi:MAG: ATP-binding cassette domain-containing protein [Sphaerochaetaceae bacterium]|nr:ATP-binding cassette domain-containing protein [Sphaerochaetaceae bacterium]